MFTIDFEAHFFTGDCLDFLSKRIKFPTIEHGEEYGSYNVNFSPDVYLYHPHELMERLLDVNQKRIDQMDEARLDVQILSLTTPSGIDSVADDVMASVKLACNTNDVLFQAIQKNPQRFRGFAAICPYDIRAGKKELERAINELGFVGWLTHSNYGKNDYLDDQKYWPLLEIAEGLNIPIYIHPTVPLIKEFAKYGFALAGSAMGFQFDTALCVMRMILGGVFDQFPRLKIILGHLGETLPFLNERLDHMFRTEIFRKYRPRIKRLPSEVLHTNIYITTSGRFCDKTLNYVINAMGEDKVLFATDYPYESMSESVKFITEADLPKHIVEKICFGNAIKLGFVKNI